VSLIVYILLIMIYMGFEAIKHKKQLAIGHETAVVIIIGFVLSRVYAVSSLEAKSLPMLNDQVFFYICMPALFFTMGFSMRSRHFFRNIGKIIMFGVVGTIIQFVLTSFLTRLWFWWNGTLTQYDPATGTYSPFTMSWLQIMLMSSLLCASDEIAAETCVDP